jgi:GxxExxY protein
MAERDDGPRIDADERGLAHSELTGQILATFYEVYNELGTGFLESVYNKAMVIALKDRGVAAVPEFPVQVFFRGQDVGEFFGDLLVEGLVIVELKAARAVDLAHAAKLLHYLRATDKEVGLILNFGPIPDFRRFAYSNDRKKRRADPR